MINKLTTTTLFDGWKETMIYSCLDGTMGEIYGNELSVAAYLGDFIFFAGKPCTEIVKFRPDWFRKDYAIMTSYSEDWHEVIESVYQKEAQKSERYAMKKENDIFDRDYLEKIVNSLNPIYEIRMINGAIYKMCQKIPFLKDLVAQYPTYEKYVECGLGCVICLENKIVSGASSYSSYQGGIEIEIDTDLDYRRQGLALVCGAKLILECLNRGLYPSWDAANKGSVALAEKLGYHFDYAYPIYEIYK